MDLGFYLWIMQWPVRNKAPYKFPVFLLETGGGVGFPSCRDFIGCPSRVAIRELSRFESAEFALLAGCVMCPAHAHVHSA